MKATLLCIAALVVYVTAESCRDTGDCKLETCTGDGWTINCHFGVCTCDHGTHTGGSCSSASDCSGTHCGGFQFLQAHCVDGACRCSIGGIGGIGK